MSLPERPDAYSVEVGSSNVYSDLGYADAEAMQRKSELAFAIGQRIRDRNVPLDEASRIANTEPEILYKICRGQFREIEEDDLIGMHVRLA